jgi:hypothetical protein
MKKLFILAIFVLSAPTLFGQTKDPKPTEMVSNEPKSASKTQEKVEELVADKPTFQRFDNMLVPDERYEGVKGSRYFYDNNFHEGALTMTRKREFGKDFLFRYDQLEGTVQMKYPDGKEVLVNQNEILNFDLFVENKSVIFIRLKTSEKDNKFSLVQVIYYSPTMKVMREPRKKLKRVENTGAYSANVIYDTYDNDYHYFMQNGEENLMEIKPTAKSFAKALPSKAKKVESLFKAAKSKGELSVSKLAEIVKKLDEKPAAESK